MAEPDQNEPLPATSTRSVRLRRAIWVLEILFLIALAATILFYLLVP